MTYGVGDGPEILMINILYAAARLRPTTEDDPRAFMSTKHLILQENGIEAFIFLENSGNSTESTPYLLQRQIRSRGVIDAVANNYCPNLIVSARTLSNEFGKQQQKPAKSWTIDYPIRTRVVIATRAQRQVKPPPKSRRIQYARKDALGTSSRCFETTEELLHPRIWQTKSPSALRTFPARTVVTSRTPAKAEIRSVDCIQPCVCLGCIVVSETTPTQVERYAIELPIASRADSGRGSGITKSSLP